VGFNLKSAAVYRTLRRGIQPMKSKLLQKISYGVSQSREVVNGQQKSTEDSSVPWRERENTTWSSQSAGGGPGPQELSRSPEVRWPTPTPAAVKMRVFGFIDWSQAGSGRQELRSKRVKVKRSNMSFMHKSL
jgi:hypothetical protein